jgi:hypothetical protein
VRLFRTAKSIAIGIPLRGATDTVRRNSVWGRSDRIEHQCKVTYRGADKSLARPTSPCILFDGENILFDASLVIYMQIVLIFLQL